MFEHVDTSAIDDTANPTCSFRLIFHVRCVILGVLSARSDMYRGI